MRFRVLGPIEAYDGDDRLPIPAGKACLLLAVLLTEPGRVVPTDRLVDILWPEDPPETCRALIHTYIATLRRALKGTDEIVTRPPGYLVRIDPDDLDSSVFERHLMDAQKYAATGTPAEAVRTFADAESLWRGAAYASIDVPAIVAEANRLEALRLAALEHRIDLELGLGRERDLHAELTALVATHPTHERLRARLMLVLYRLGRQADALAAYHEAREALADALGIEPGPELQRTHEAILRGDRTLLPASRATQTARPAVAVDPPAPPTRAAESDPKCPAQLPILPADFTGRAAAVAEVAARMTGADPAAAPATRTCVIAGRSGAGKSTLALRVAHDLAPSFPDGQLYVDLRGATETPTPSVEVLGRFLRALGTDPAALPDSLEERADLFRTILAHRRVLVLIDDAAGEQQVRPLLPGGAGNGVVITARRRLAGLAGAAHLELDVLDPDEAVQMLGRIAGGQRVADEPDRARELLVLCGHLPLAVRIVGARLASRPHWTLAGMVARLADETRRLDELAVADQQVRAGIEVTYQGLDGRARAALRALSWMDLPDFPAWITARLLNVSATDGEDAVEALVDAHLLDVTQVDAVGQPRYRIHDLIQVYAREQAVATDPADQRDAAVRRLMGTWLWLIDQIMASTPPGAIPFAPELPRIHAADPEAARPVITAPSAWLEAEQSALVSAVERSAALGLVDVSVALATALCGSVFSLGNQFEAWSRTHTAALAAARAAADRSAEAILLVQLGQLHYTKDDYAPAHRYLLESLSLFRELGDGRGEATAQASLGWICREQGRLAEALHFLGQAHGYFTTTSLGSASGYTGRLIGTTHLEQGDFEQARVYLTESVAAYRRCGSRQGEALSIRSLGLVYRAVGELEAALALCRDALDILVAVGDEKHEAYGLQGVAKTLIRLGRIDDALPMVDRALSISTQLDDIWGVAFMLRTRGEAHLAAGRLAQAEADLTEAIRVWTGLDVTVMRARAERDLATVLDAKGDHATAQAVRRRALTTFKTYGAREYLELTAHRRP